MQKIDEVLLSKQRIILLSRCKIVTVNSKIQRQNGNIYIFLDQLILLLSTTRKPWCSLSRIIFFPILLKEQKKIYLGNSNLAYRNWLTGNWKLLCFSHLCVKGKINKQTNKHSYSINISSGEVITKPLTYVHSYLW